MPSLSTVPAQTQNIDQAVSMLQDLQTQQMPSGFDLDQHGQLAEKMQQMTYDGSPFPQTSTTSSRSASAEAQQQQQLNASYGNMNILQPPADLHSSDSDSRGMSSDGEGQSTSQFF